MKILFTTVGSSHTPVLQGVSQLQPDYTIFICSGGDSSSERMITGQGKIIKAKRNDPKPTLPNIPTQLGLAENTYHVILIPTDDLDAAVQRIDKEMALYQDKGNLFADYTGGTKTMTAALVLASLDHDVQLYLVKGARTDLEGVVDGTQCCSRAIVAKIRFNREFKNNLNAWKQFAYGSASQGLASINPPADSEVQDRFMMGKNLSDAFDAWDRFDHKKARQLLFAYRSKVAKSYSPYIQILDLLCSNNDPAKMEGARIYDLWLNAGRCAAQARYDDAVARAYRMIEWVAQWVLRTQCSVDTSDLPADFIPDDIKIFKNHSDKYQAPLRKAWELVERKTTGPANTFIKTYGDDLLTILGIRNSSILAHGLESVTQAKWKAVNTWMEGKLLPAFTAELTRTGLRKLPPQLPCEYIW
ncbi:MAG: TIGR02710 family CRISPR-associated CARF protein [Desulfoplanes sp.]